MDCGTSTGWLTPKFTHKPRATEGNRERTPMNTNPERHCSLVDVSDTLWRTLGFKGDAGLTAVIRVDWRSFAVETFYPRIRLTPDG